MKTEELKELKLEDKPKGKCDVCGGDLDDDGLCPDCDLGETESDDDSLDESPDEEIE